MTWNRHFRYGFFHTVLVVSVVELEPEPPFFLAGAVAVTKEAVYLRRICPQGTEAFEVSCSGKMLGIQFDQWCDRYWNLHPFVSRSEPFQAGEKYQFWSKKGTRKNFQKFTFKNIFILKLLYTITGTGYKIINDTPVQKTLEKGFMDFPELCMIPNSL